MNAQVNCIPETVTVTLTREDIEAFAGESDDAYADLVESIHGRGASEVVTDIVKRSLIREGNRTRETRKVSRNHAELALCAAIQRMYSAIHHALNAPDPEHGGDADLRDMALEAGLSAAETALELTSIDVLNIGIASENEPTGTECLRQWSESFNGTGDELEVKEETRMDMVFMAAQVLFNLDDEQVASLKEKAQELTYIRRLSIQKIQEGSIVRA